MHEDVLGEIQAGASPLTKPEHVKQLAQALKDKKVVMLGEATHGTAEFYKIRAELSRLLIRDHGFSFVAVEGDWPEATRLRRYIQKAEGRSAVEVLKNIHRWPRWMCTLFLNPWTKCSRT